MVVLYELLKKRLELYVEVLKLVIREEKEVFVRIWEKFFNIFDYLKDVERRDVFVKVF